MILFCDQRLNNEEGVNCNKIFGDELSTAVSKDVHQDNVKDEPMVK